ncbi:unnamed protein product [Effrenium voratum]|nr:unnamed protein product [Effrenium voratum]
MLWKDMALKLGVLPQEHWPNSDVSPDNTAERPDCYDVADSKVDSSVPQDVHGARPLQDASVRASCGVVRPPTRAMPTKPQLRYRRRQICPRLKNRAIHEDLGEMVAPNEGLAEPAMWVDGDHIPVLGKWEKEMPELMDDTSPGSDGETRVIFKVPEDWRKAEKEAQELRELLEAELLEQQEVEEKLAREREADTLSLFLNGQWQEITTDTYLPCAHKQPAFAHHESQELYACFLEKACAKAHGSYAALIGGHVDEALMDLTEAAVEEVAGLARPDLGLQLAKYWQRGDLLACAQVNSVARDLPVRLNHTYVVSDVDSQPGQPGQVRLQLLDLSGADGAESTWGRTCWLSLGDFALCFNRLSICHAGRLLDAELQRREKRTAGQMRSWEYRQNQLWEELQAIAESVVGVGAACPNSGEKTYAAVVQSPLDILVERIDGDVAKAALDRHLAKFAGTESEAEHGHSLPLPALPPRGVKSAPNLARSLDIDEDGAETDELQPTKPAKQPVPTPPRTCRESSGRQAMVRLLLVRHAQSANKCRLPGQVAEADPGLTDYGLQQANALGHRLAKDFRSTKVSRVIFVSSPMRHGSESDMNTCTNSSLMQSIQWTLEHWRCSSFHPYVASR